MHLFSRKTKRLNRLSWEITDKQRESITPFSVMIIILGTISKSILTTAQKAMDHYCKPKLITRLPLNLIFTTKLFFFYSLFLFFKSKLKRFYKFKLGNIPCAGVVGWMAQRRSVNMLFLITKFRLGMASLILITAFWVPTWSRFSLMQAVMPG